LLAKDGGSIAVGTKTPNSKVTWLESKPGTLNRDFCLFLQSLEKIMAMQKMAQKWQLKDVKLTEL
jgi:hypothetical protein